MNEKNDSLKNDAVISLYNNCYEHIRHIKSNQWQVTILIVVLVFAVNSVARLAIQPPQFIIHIKAGLTVFTIFSLAYGFWHLKRLQDELSWQRELRYKIENEIFKFSESGAYIRERPLIKSHFRNDRFQTLGDLAKFVSWIIIIGITALFTLYSIWCLAGVESRVG